MQSFTRSEAGGVRWQVRILVSQVRNAALLGTAAALSLFPAQANAQTESSPPVASRVASDEIVITARRRDEPLGRAGAPVSVVTGEELERSGVTQVDQLNQLFPALTVQPTATGNLIFIRGVGNFTLQPNSDPALGFAYDGVFVARPIATTSQFFDLERVELLKGPQGVLYGRNASAGSLNLEPRQPVIGETSARLNLSAASYAHELADGAVNLPIGSNAALRLSGALSTQHHFLKGYRDGPEQRSGRAQLKALVGTRLTVKIAADYNRIGGVGVGTGYIGNYVYAASEGRYRFVDAELPASVGIYAPEAQAYRQTIFLTGAGRNLDTLGSRPRQKNEFYGAHARVDAKLGFADLTIIPAWRKTSVDATVSGSPFGYLQIEDNEQTSVEARLTGRRGRLEWLGGLFWFDETIDSDVTTNLSSSLSFTRQWFETRSSAAFGNVTLHASPRLRLSGGLRWTRDRRTFLNETDSATIICPPSLPLRCPNVPLFSLVTDFADAPFPVPQVRRQQAPIVVAGVPTGAMVARGGRDQESRLTDRALTWRAGVEYDVGTESLLYATAETGYRPGGFNAATGFEFYDPERIGAFTLGLRNRSLGGRLQFDVEAFWWNYRDQQVSSLRPDLSDPPANANITETIGNSRIRGVEADVRLRPWRGAQLGAIVQFLDAKYRSFEYLQANIRVPPLTGCDAKLDAGTNLYTVDCSGQRPYNSPRWSMSLNARQALQLKDLTLALVGDTHFRSVRNIGFAFLPEQRVGPTWTSNAQLILGVPRHRIEIAAFVRNIEGTRVPQFSNFHPVSNALIAVTAPPCQWGLRTSLQF